MKAQTRPRDQTSLPRRPVCTPAMPTATDGMPGRKVLSTLSGTRAGHLAQATESNRKVTKYATSRRPWFLNSRVRPLVLIVLAPGTFGHWLQVTTAVALARHLAARCSKEH